MAAARRFRPPRDREIRRCMQLRARPPEAPRAPIRGRAVRPLRDPVAACLSALFFAALPRRCRSSAPLGFPLAAVPLVRRGAPAGTRGRAARRGALPSAILCGVGARRRAAGGRRSALGLAAAFAARAAPCSRLRGAARRARILRAPFSAWRCRSASFWRPRCSASRRRASRPIADRAARRLRHDDPGGARVLPAGGMPTPRRSNGCGRRSIGAREFTAPLLGGADRSRAGSSAAAVAFYAGARAARPAPSAERRRGSRALRVPAGVRGALRRGGRGLRAPAGRGRTVAGDVLLALAALYFVAGLSIICHFARRWFRAWFLRFGPLRPGRVLPDESGGGASGAVRLVRELPPAGRERARRRHESDPGRRRAGPRAPRRHRDRQGRLRAQLPLSAGLRLRGDVGQPAAPVGGEEEVRREDVREKDVAEEVARRWTVSRSSSTRRRARRTSSTGP